MAGLSGVSTPAVVAAGAGALALWVALKGASLTGGVRSLVGGQAPSGANVDPITGGSTVPGGAGQLVNLSGTTGSAVADAGLRYVGSGSVYRWGGGTPKGWDCSGFVNYVVGHDLGLAIPGSRNGKYSGHGPATPQWAVFGRSIRRADVEAGDLVVWPLHHMGIAISSSQMVNAPGPNGTPAPVISPIDEHIGGPRVFRRIVMATGTTQSGSGAGGRG